MSLLDHIFAEPAPPRAPSAATQTAPLHSRSTKPSGRLSAGGTLVLPPPLFHGFLSPRSSPAPLALRSSGRAWRAGSGAFESVMLSLFGQIPKYGILGRPGKKYVANSAASQAVDGRKGWVGRWIGGWANWIGKEKARRGWFGPAEKRQGATRGRRKTKTKRRDKTMLARKSKSVGEVGMKKKTVHFFRPTLDYMNKAPRPAPPPCTGRGSWYTD
jgi:hypothetical protein